MLKLCGSSRGSYVVSRLPPTTAGQGGDETNNSDSLGAFRKNEKSKKIETIEDRSTFVWRLQNSMRRKHNEWESKTCSDAYDNDDWIFEKKNKEIEFEVREMLSSEYNEMIEKREKIMQSNLFLEQTDRNSLANSTLRKYDGMDNLVANDDEQDHVTN